MISSNKIAIWRRAIVAIPKLPTNEKKKNWFIVQAINEFITGYKIEAVLFLLFFFVFSSRREIAVQILLNAEMWHCVTYQPPP